MRALTVVLLILGAGVAMGARAEEGFGPLQVAPASQPFKVGRLQLIAVHDAQYVPHNDGKVFGGDVGPAAVAELLKANGLPDDRITLSVNALVLRTGHRVILLDSGIGPKGHGALLASLKDAGVTPESVTDVLVTHTHGDHVGGLLDAAGGLALPKAVIRMAGPEWAWLKSRPEAADLVKAIEPRVQTFVPGKPIAPGVTPIALDGHTPGHVGYEIVSGKARLLDVGDLVHSSLVSLRKPEWTMGFDSDAAVAKATRKSMLARLAKDQELVFAPHFPFPGVGHIASDGEAFGWRPGTP